MIRKYKSKIVIPYRPLIKWLVRLRRSPRAIAGGFALGTFVAFTPTVGIQFAIVIFLATIFNLNRGAALVTIWITNVATMTPIFTFNYMVGSLFWSGPSVKEVASVFMELTNTLVKMELWDMLDQFRTVLNLSTDIIVPLMIGSVMVGAVAAGLVYVASMTVMRSLAARRYRRRRLD
ncbi:MAG: DUF2062 domain-containing protein [Desulfofustis sp. PB-SRB1]|nr:DUF2062 domain-containing protein [Desulfofustis sp. PB-SRB1]MBM1002506.1 DUF2062 domain-containing protein [Desulfofustis sp. PB-SRB1]HBH27638.1 DUF2062 domain-containing protein [Desulfofustis sp.]